MSRVKTQTRGQVPQHILDRVRQLADELKGRWFCRSDGCHMIGEVDAVVVKYGRSGYIAKFYTDGMIVKVVIGEDGEVRRITVEP